MDIVHYHLNLSGLLPKSVRKGVLPVHIFSQESFSGCGTLVLGPNGEHRNIFTASHLFPTGSLGGYYYKVLQPPSQQLLPLEMARGIPTLKEDLAICRPGANVRPIFGFSDKQPGYNGLRTTAQYTPFLDPQPNAIHILSGKNIPVVGMVVNGEGERYFLLALETFQGESGLGFLDPERENALYVLRGVLLDRDEACLKATANYPHLSLAALMGYGPPT